MTLRRVTTATLEMDLWRCINGSLHGCVTTFVLRRESQRPLTAECFLLGMNPIRQSQDDGMSWNKGKRLNGPQDVIDKRDPGLQLHPELRLQRLGIPLSFSSESKIMTE